MVCGLGCAVYGVWWCGVVWCVCPGRMERRCYGCRLELTSYYPHPYTCRHSFSLPPTQGHCWLYTGSAVWLSLWGRTPHSLLLAQALGRMTSKLCYSDACNTPNTQHPIPSHPHAYMTHTLLLMLCSPVCFVLFWFYSVCSPLPPPLCILHLLGIACLDVACMLHLWLQIYAWRNLYWFT